jgi:hypothetical protein
MQKMPPAVERLVRLMLMLPSDPHGPLWSSVADDCEDITTVIAIRGWVGDTAKMWPEGAPRTLAEMFLTAFGNPSETTLLLLSQAVGATTLRDHAGTGAGAAWVARALETAIDVLSDADSLEEILERAEAEWS